MISHLLLSLWDRISLALLYMPAERSAYVEIMLLLTIRTHTYTHTRFNCTFGFLWVKPYLLLICLTMPALRKRWLSQWNGQCNCPRRTTRFLGIWDFFSWKRMLRASQVPRSFSFPWLPKWRLNRKMLRVGESQWEGMGVADTSKAEVNLKLDLWALCSFGRHHFIFSKEQPQGKPVCIWQIVDAQQR